MFDTIQFFDWDGCHRTFSSPTAEGTYFGQSLDGHLHLANFGHRGFTLANFGQNQVWPIQF